MADAARLLTDFAKGAPFGLALLDHDLRFIFVNEAMAAINGFPADEHVGRSVWDIVSDAGIRAMAEPVLKQVLATGEPIYGVHLAGSTHGSASDAACWVEDFLPVRNDSGTVVAVAGLVRDVAEDQRTRSELRESQERLRLALDAAQLGTWERDLQRDVYDGDAWARRIFGITDEGPLPGDEVRRRIHPDDLARVLAAPAQVSEQDANALYEIEYRILHDGSDERWVSVRGSLAFDERNKPVRFLGTVRDITARKQEEERQRLLVAELDHRVKNVLGLVSALVDQSLQAKGVPPTAQGDLQARIQSLATAHSLISRTGWQGAALRELVEAELAPYRAPKGRIDISGDDIMLAPSTVQPLAMALHELASNAAKHGALSGLAGRLTVSWARQPDGALVIDWRETSTAAPPDAVGTGFGMRLLRDILPRERDLDIDLRLEPEGAACRIRIGRTLRQPATKSPRGSEAPDSDRDGAVDIAGLRVLIAEDEVLIAHDLEEELQAAGCHVVANCQDVDDVLAVLDQVRPDVSVLDMNLRGQKVYPVADRLQSLGIPFLFATGYSEALTMPPAYRDVPMVAKLYKRGGVISMLKKIVAAAR